MADMKQVYDFAVKWLDKFRDDKINYIELVDHYMADDCDALGYKMDCSNAFSERYEKAVNDYEELDKIIDDVNDIDLLGSAIYSQWRYFNHWAYTGEEILDIKNRSWFILALSRLAMLAGKNLFEGTPRKIRIVSNNICYGPCPVSTDEVEQHITINAEGRVWFSAYIFGEGLGQYEKGRTKNFNIEKSIASKVLNTVATFFSQGYNNIFATDIGEWNMEMTNMDGKTYKFTGSLCDDFEVDGIDLSDLIRDALKMNDLYAFDGNCKPDMINRIVVDYNRTTKIKPNQVSNYGTLEHVTWDYSEQLIVDRETESVEHIQRIGPGCIITRKYKVEEGVPSLLDDLDVDFLFENIEGNPPDVVDNPNETKEYTITLDFKKKLQRVIKGSFDKNGLPKDWTEFATDIFSFMRFYGLGEIFDPSVYNKAKRRAGDYMFCSVEFNEGGKSYYYISDDDTIEVGDFVIVPVGKDENTAVEIVDIEYFPEDKVPFPLDKVKRIIRKCTDDDFNIPIEVDSQENQSIELDKIKHIIEKRSDNKDLMGSFQGFVLCNEETSRVKVNVWVELSEGGLIIAGQDLGEAVWDFFGEDEYEYFYQFDRENTERLFALLTPERQKIREMLLQKFGGIDGCCKLRKFCAVNNIIYNFFSC